MALGFRDDDDKGANRMIFFALISAISVCVTWAAELQQLKVVNGIQEIMRPVPIPGERWQEAQAALKRGHALILEGKYDEAEKILRPAVALSRGNADDIEQELSEISLRQGKYQVAYDLIDKVRPELGDGRRYARMAFLKAALGDYAGSKAMWDDAGSEIHKGRLCRRLARHLHCGWAQGLLAPSYRGAGIL